MTDVGQRLKSIREKKKLSQYRLSKLSGVAQPTISAIEAEGQTRSPAVDTVERLAAALGCTVSDIMGETSGNYLTAQEKKLINDFRSLNQQGREYVLQSMAMAVRIYLSGKPGAVSGVESRAE